MYTALLPILPGRRPHFFEWILIVDYGCQSGRFAAKCAVRENCEGRVADYYFMRWWEFIVSKQELYGLKRKACSSLAL